MRRQKRDRTMRNMPDIVLLERFNDRCGQRGGDGSLLTFLLLECGSVKVFVSVANNDDLPERCAPRRDKTIRYDRSNLLDLVLLLLREKFDLIDVPIPPPMTSSICDGQLPVAWRTRALRNENSIMKAP